MPDNSISNLGARALARVLPRRRLLTVLVAGATIPLLAACGGSATAIVTASTTRTTTVAATPSLASTTSRTAAAPATSAATTTSATTTSAAAAPVATAAPTQPVAAGSKLVFWNATEGTVTGYEQGDKNGFLDYFRAKHPEIQLEADYFPDIYTKYEKTAVAGTPPDVSFVSVVSVYDYAKKGFLTNLQPYWNRSKLGMGNYYQVFFDAMRYPSTTADLYAIPYEWINTWLTYNKDLFQHAGVPFPDETWTYAKVRDTAHGLTDSTKPQWGTTSSIDYSHLGCIIPSNGGSHLSPDYRKCTFDSPENVNTIQYLHDLMYKDNAAPPSGTKAPDKGWFVNNQQSISMWDCCGTLGTYRQSKGLSWDITLNPKGTKGQYNVGWSNQYVISTVSKVKDSAWELITDSIRPDRPPLTFGQGKAPIIKAAAEAWLVDQKNEPPANLKVYLDEQYLTQLVVGPNWNDWQKVLNQQLNDALQNKVSVPDAVTAATKAVQVVLDKAFAS
jgi:multiple sugar transport system substrate-binding protein